MRPTDPHLTAALHKAKVEVKLCINPEQKKKKKKRFIFNK